MKQILLIGLLILAVIVSGCATKAPTTTGTQTTPTTTGGNLGIKKDVTISGFAFNPDTITIPKETSVIWTNMDTAPHTIVSDTGSEIDSNSIAKGETYVHTFNTPGTYTYHCGIHPSMKGTVIVE
jgi:plastocyanin